MKTQEINLKQLRNIARGTYVEAVMNNGSFACGEFVKVESNRLVLTDLQDTTELPLTSLYSVSIVSK